MTSDDETVPVRVKDLKGWLLRAQGFGLLGLEKDVAAYIPKPRLVTVDLDELKAIYNNDSPRVRHDMVGDLIQRLEQEA